MGKNTLTGRLLAAAVILGLVFAATTVAKRPKPKQQRRQGEFAADGTPTNAAGLMQTSAQTALLANNSESARKLLELPPGQIVENLSQQDDWVRVKLFNGGPEGYLPLRDLQWCLPEGNGAQLPQASVSVINLASGKPDIYFRQELKPAQEPNELGKNINFPAEAQRLGFDGEQRGPSAQDRELPLPDGIALTMDRAYKNSSIYFVDKTAGKLAGIITPTPPNMDAQLCGQNLYVTQTSSAVVVNYAERKIAGAIALGSPATKMLCAGGRLYVALPDANAVAVINPASNKVESRIPVGPNPDVIWQCRDTEICVENTGMPFSDD